MHLIQIRIKQNNIVGRDCLLMKFNKYNLRNKSNYEPQINEDFTEVLKK